MPYSPEQHSADKAYTERNMPPPDPQETWDDRANLLRATDPMLRYADAVENALRLLDMQTELGKQERKRLAQSVREFVDEVRSSMTRLLEEAEERERHWR